MIIPSFRSRRRRSSRSSKCSSIRSSGPPAEVLESLINEADKHIAMSHEDTTDGAVHCFQDEFGKWADVRAPREALVSVWIMEVYWSFFLNSLAPRRCGSNFKSEMLKLVLQKNSLGTHSKIALR